MADKTNILPATAGLSPMVPTKSEVALARLHGLYRDLSIDCVNAIIAGDKVAAIAIEARLDDIRSQIVAVTGLDWTR